VAAADIWRPSCEVNPVAVKNEVTGGSCRLPESRQLLTYGGQAVNPVAVKNEVTGGSWQLGQAGQLAARAVHTLLQALARFRTRLHSR
jgi:hypothetical protein